MDSQSKLIAKLVAFLLLRKYEAGRTGFLRAGTRRAFQGRPRQTSAKRCRYLEALRVIERRAKSGIYMSNEDASIEALALFAQLGIPLDAADVQHTSRCGAFTRSRPCSWRANGRPSRISRRCVDT